VSPGCWRPCSRREDAVHGTLEHHHLDLVVVFEGRDNVSDLQHELRTHEIERRVVQYDAPV
jgi:hypothetical protein